MDGDWVQEVRERAPPSWAAGWAGDGVIDPEQEGRKNYRCRQEGRGFCYIRKS